MLSRKLGTLGRNGRLSWKSSHHGGTECLTSGFQIYSEAIIQQYRTTSEISLKKWLGDLIPDRGSAIIYSTGVQRVMANREYTSPGT